MSDSVGEWREGWGFYRGARCKWTSWGFGLNISIGLGTADNREWGIYLDLGPFFAWASLEHEHRLYENGKPTELAVARVHG